MSHPIALDWHSSHYQAYLSAIYNLPSEGVVDLTGCIDCGDFITAGASGQIFKGKWKKPSSSLEHHPLPNVAVKLVLIPALTDEKQKEKRFKRIKREVELWRQLNHRNILPLVGIARIDGDGNRLAFISPWMEHGNVADFLKHNPTFPAVSFLHDIIEGLHFLHTFKPEIIHGDIKAVNVLVNYRKEAYLCDFGLSRFVVDNTLWRTTATQASGTLRWMAPELIEGDVSTSTKASDICLWDDLLRGSNFEILSGKVPFDTARTDASVMRKLLAGDRPERILSCHPDGLWSTITQCWTQNAEERPSTGDALKSVVQFIEGSDKLKKEIINIKATDPEKPSIEIPLRPPSLPSPSPPLHAPSSSTHGPLSPPTRGSAFPDTGRSNISPAVYVLETTTPRKIAFNDAGVAEIKLPPLPAPSIMTQNAQIQAQEPPPFRIDTSARQRKQLEEEEHSRGDRRGSGDKEKEQPGVEAEGPKQSDETKRLPTVTGRPQRVARIYVPENSTSPKTASRSAGDTEVESESYPVAPFVPHRIVSGGAGDTIIPEPTYVVPLPREIPSEGVGYTENVLATAPLFKVQNPHRQTREPLPFLSPDISQRLDRLADLDYDTGSRPRSNTTTSAFNALHRLRNRLYHSASTPFGSSNSLVTENSSEFRLRSAQDWMERLYDERAAAAPAAAAVASQTQSDSRAARSSLSSSSLMDVPMEDDSRRPSGATKYHAPNGAERSLIGSIDGLDEPRQSDPFSFEGDNIFIWNSVQGQ